MQRIHCDNVCKCCGKSTNDWKNINEQVIVGDQTLPISEMCGVFKLPVVSLASLTGLPIQLEYLVRHMFTKRKVFLNSVLKNVCMMETDGLCWECLEQLKYCYQFYVRFLSGLVSLQKLSSPRQSLCVPEDKTTHCTFCGTGCGSILELNKHLKLVHPFPEYRFYHCRPCKKSFKTNRGMLQHKTIFHDSSESYTCQMCDRVFITKTNYQNHMRYHKDFLCYFCNTGWLTESKLFDHVRVAHSDRLFLCRYCDRTERLRKCLNRHLRSSHLQESNPFYCGHCANEDVAYGSFEALTDHLLDQHNQEEEKKAHLADDTCVELLNNSLFIKDLSSLELHEADAKHNEQVQFLHNLQLTRSAAREKAFTPRQPEPRIDRRMVLEDFLDEAFENDEIWKKYIENGEEYLIDDYDFYLNGLVDGAGVQQDSCMYRCPRCDRGFQKQIQLSVHLAEGHEIASLVCNDCGASFTRLLAYRAHRKEHLKENVRFRESNIPEMEEALALVQSAQPRDYSVQEEENGYRFTCKLCDRSFQRKHNLEKHNCRFYDHLEQEPDAAERVNQCPHCDYRTHSRKDLCLHQETDHHTSNAISTENIYCTLCDRRFSSTSGLKYHLKRHTGIKAFTCLYCGKKFTANTNLNAHIRNVHSERKAHQCTECNETFATKDHLNKHQRSRHRKERPFACGECEKSYYQRSHLNEHIAACHRESRYLCQICKSSYVCRSSLKRHQQLKHAHDIR